MCTSSGIKHSVEVTDGMATIFVNGCPALIISVEEATKLFRDLSAQHRAQRFHELSHSPDFVYREIGPLPAVASAMEPTYVDFYE